MAIQRILVTVTAVTVTIAYCDSYIWSQKRRSYTEYHMIGKKTDQKTARNGCALSFRYYRKPVKVTKKALSIKDLK